MLKLSPKLTPLSLFLLLILCLWLTGCAGVQSNATRIEGNTAIWENSLQVEVTLTESSGFSVWTIQGSVAACAGAGGSHALCGRRDGSGGVLALAKANTLILIL